MIPTRSWGITEKHAVPVTNTRQDVLFLLARNKRRHRTKRNKSKVLSKITSSLVSVIRLAARRRAGVFGFL
ncbi:hypothetical protein TNCV_789461 [Trichonephila clavipes]|nr:hypothetical protein TNCV_789461 [Trichonephila clavipes]